MTGRVAAAGELAPLGAGGHADDQRPVYVVYPAALFDGWEVVRDCEDDPSTFGTREEATAYARARAAMSGGGIVKLENWFGDTEGVWDVPARGAHGIGLVVA